MSLITSMFIVIFCALIAVEGVEVLVDKIVEKQNKG